MQTTLVRDRIDENFPGPVLQYLDRYPALKKPGHFDVLRQLEYARLDADQHVYLDFTGGNLYAVSQVNRHLEFLRTQVLGNPHSVNPTSLASTQFVESARKAVLDFFTAKEYTCIFTANASAALQIVGECYPFTAQSHLLLLSDNHNSVNGIREYCKHKGASYSYTFIDQHNEMRIDDDQLTLDLHAHSATPNKLFAYPAQSNVSGVKHDLRWIERAHAAGWDVLLDAAAFVPTTALDLSRVKPDFVSISFYKIFGYPTGLGCLLVHNTAFSKLQKPAFAGGTISLVSVGARRHFLLPGHERFENGTVNYLSIPAIEIGLDYINAIGMNYIEERVTSLTALVLDELTALRHRTGQPLIRIIGPCTTEKRGGTIAMNFYNARGEEYPFQHIEQEATRLNISLRTGCFCNPGIDELAHAISATELTRYFNSTTEGNYYDAINFLGKLRGSVRISVGFITNVNDVIKFMVFARSFLDR